LGQGGGEPHGTNEEEPEEEMGEVEEEGWQRLSKKCKSEMNKDKLFAHLESQLRGGVECPNKRCNCLAIMDDANARAFVMKYLCWFFRKSKYKQDSILFEWFKYSSYLKKGQSKLNQFWLPYINDGTGAVVNSSVCKHVICTPWGLQLLLNIGMKRYQSIWTVSTFTAVLPTHKTIRKQAPHAINQNEHKYEPMMRHFEYLSNLAEVRVMQVVALLVDGMQGCKNCDDAQDAVYLPISMGYRSCYKRYMALLGYKVQSTAMGKFIVEGEDGKEVDSCDYVTYPTYFISGSVTSQTLR
jgi:hypothetical protein